MDLIQVSSAPTCTRARWVRHRHSSDLSPLPRTGEGRTCGNPSPRRPQGRTQTSPGWVSCLSERPVGLRCPTHLLLTSRTWDERRGRRSSQVTKDSV